ncbi:21400_t:CDS:2, partial [Gigaspora margarita]
LPEVKQYVSTKGDDMSYSTEEFVKVFKRELKLKSNDCNIYKSAKDKAANLLQSLMNSNISDINDQEISANGYHNYETNIDG